MGQDSLDNIKKWYQEHSKQILDDLFTFLRFRSISTDPAFQPEVHSCAQWLCDYLKKIGMTSELIPTSVHPLVYAENLQAGKDKPTLLFYGHYDVQPADPLEKWRFAPFTPTLQNNQIFARGATDNKGQLFCVVTALRALLENKHLPVNVKLCIEGEEESASLGFAKVLPKIKDKLACDSLVVVDVDIPSVDSPAVTLGARGITTLNIELTGSNTDLHSGGHGGIAYNPLKALVQILAPIWDKEGKIAVPHFYDDVVPMTEEEKKILDTTFHKEEYKKTFGVTAFAKQQGNSYLESNWLHPTVEINGLGGGYQGAGIKSVIPAKAIAKLSCRLVPHQNPDKIAELLSRFLKDHAPAEMGLEIDYHFGGKGVRANPEAKIVKAAAKAYEEVFQKSCHFILSGGSIPIIGDLINILGSDLVLMGFGLASDNIHAPNEHFSLDRLEKGVITIARMLSISGEL